MQSIWIDADSSKGRSEEVAKAFEVSLNQIDTYRSYEGRTLILGHITDSGGGGVIEILSSELRNIYCISLFYRIFNFFMCAQSKALQKSV